MDADAMFSLKAILKKVKAELEEKEKVRQKAQVDMRKATSLSKQAILLIHQKKMKHARQLIEEARETITGLNKTADEYPEIAYTGMFYAARQEYAEANIFLKLIEEGKLLSPEEVGVPSVDYALGLADVIGEYRRAALDALREGNVEKGEKYLRVIDEIYVELLALDEAYMLVPGLRRKCDVARRIIEATRGDVTQEIRRDALERNLKRFEKSVRLAKA